MIEFSTISVFCEIVRDTLECILHKGWPQCQIYLYVFGWILAAYDDSRAPNWTDIQKKGTKYGNFGIGWVIFNLTLNWT